jgi:DNA-binding PadR family transcriptional regulator
MPNPNSNAYPPLKPTDLQLLLALAQEEQHGYGLVQSIERATNGVVTLDPGNFYRVIKRLLADGLIAEAERRRAPDGDHERRRYYRITVLGRRVLADDLRRLQALVKSPAVRTIMREWAT